MFSVSSGLGFKMPLMTYKDYRKRVLDDGGGTEAETCFTNAVLDLQRLNAWNDASLVMIPSGYKDGTLYSVKPTDGSGDFSFSRGSNLAATRVNSAGLIEKGRENLLLQSNTFDTTWTTNNSSVTGGQAGYDGSSDAWLLEKSASAGYLRQNIASSNLQTYSIYAKAGTLNWIVLESVVIGNSYFDLENGVVGNASASLIDKNIESVGNGWYRCSISYDATISQVRVFPADGNGNVSGTSGNILIQDAQLEAGLVATDYIETGATTAQAGILEDMPRLDYSGGGCPSLLLEPQRTNLITQSEYFDSWIKDGVTVTTNATTSPEGYENAQSIIEGTGSAQHRLLQGQTITSSQSYTISCYVKRNSGSRQFAIISVNAGIRVYYDLTNGSVGSQAIGTGTIENVGNGWYRCTATGTSTSTSTSTYLCLTNATTTGSETYTGDGTSSLYFYGAMLEEGSYPTSYIPTYGASVTRGADACYKTGISSLIGQTEGTVYWEGYIDVSRANYGYFPRLAIIGDGTSANFAGVLLTQSNQLTTRFVVSSVNQASITHNIITSGTYKIAFAYKQNDFVLYVNGTNVGSDTSGNVVGLSRFYIGGELGDGNTPTSHPTSQALLFKTRLTNAELTALTTL